MLSFWTFHIGKVNQKKMHELQKISPFRPSEVSKSIRNIHYCPCVVPFDGADPSKKNLTEEDMMKSSQNVYGLLATLGEMLIKHNHKSV